MAETSGIVFNIQRYSTHDGPGIRTTAFLKGCPLNCRWCANPESQRERPQVMLQNSKCIACGSCIEACPRKAIQVNDGRREIDWKSCTQCGTCADACPSGAITIEGQEYAPERLFDVLGKDSVFYESSGGGVTFSGGEPLCQWKFVVEVAKLCKKAGISTCLDTTGYASWDVIEEVSRYIDLFLYDVKHTEAVAHKAMTGVDNGLIIENLRRLSPRKRVWVRLPVIPGFNDSDSNMRAVGRLAEEVDADRITLLPYHAYGAEKHDRIGREYGGTSIQTPSNEALEALKTLLGEYSTEVFIG